MVAHRNQDNHHRPKLRETEKIVPTAVPLTNGAGSHADWDAADTSGFPQYIFNEGGQIVKLNPNIGVSFRSTNPHRWNWNTPTGCLAPVFP